MEFDIFVSFVCISVALSSALLIYFILKITMRNSSYDDIKASRRQDKSQIINNDQTSDAKRLKKMKKKIKKESKENSNAVVSQYSSEKDASKEIINLPPEEICDNITVVPPAKIKHKMKVSKKTIGNETNEPAPDKYSELNPEETSSNYEQPFVDNSAKIESIPLQERDVINNSPFEESANTNEQSKIKKKVKKKKGDGLVNEESGKMSLQDFLPLLKQAEFSHGEVQILIDALLNRDYTEWLKGKQDPLIKMKKQLMEMEKLHYVDTETINGLQVKFASLRTDLNSEKNNSKVLREALIKSSEEKESLLANIQQMKQQVNDEHIMVIKLQEERLILSQMNVSHEQHHEAVVALQSQVNQLAAQLTDEQTLNANLAAQLDENLRFEEEYRQVNALNVELNHMLSNSQYEVNQLNTEVVSLSKQLEDSRAQITDLSSMLQAIETEKNELQTLNDRLQVEVSIANRDAITYQKLANTLEHNLEENKMNGNVHFHNEHTEYQPLLEEKDETIKTLNKDLSQKEITIEKLKNDIVNCKNEANKKQTMLENLNVELAASKFMAAKISSELGEEKQNISSLHLTIANKTETINELTKEVELIKRRNNELRNKNWKVVEALEKAESSLKGVASPQNDNLTFHGSDTSLIKSRISLLMQPLVSSKISDFSNIEDTDLWLAKVEEILNSLKEDSSKEQILAQNIKLQNLITHYRSVISDLEKMLLELENRIESVSDKPKSMIQSEVDIGD